MGSASRRFISGRRSTQGLGLNELRELRQLREENAKLKRLVADLRLDRHVLQDIVAKKL
jgi:putative transposase